MGAAARPSALGAIGGGAAGAVRGFGDADFAGSGLESAGVGEADDPAAAGTGFGDGTGEGTVPADDGRTVRPGAASGVAGGVAAGINLGVGAGANAFVAAIVLGALDWTWVGDAGVPGGRGGDGAPFVVSALCSDRADFGGRC